jgi:hypothetical protein
MESFDYSVGAGSAGCALANRLTATGDWRLLRSTRETPTTLLGTSRSRIAHISGMARAATPPPSTTRTAWPTRRPSWLSNRSSRSALSFRRPTSSSMASSATGRRQEAPGEVRVADDWEDAGELVQNAAAEAAKVR